MNYLTVEGNPSLVRDPVSNAIVNTNLSEYNAYINKKNSKKNELKRIDNIENQIVNLKDDLNEIKFLLRSILNEKI